MARRTQTKSHEALLVLLRALRLPAFMLYFLEAAQRAEKEGWSYERYLHHLAEQEVSERRERRITRQLKRSQLPAEKTLATLERKLPPYPVLTIARLGETSRRRGFDGLEG